ncbi:hypothetical protein NDU88_001271 [Pleurodeles waltl]|uniref:Uncharacterized protein n=1 Tax=Pleurodeles waltl TaxID=8319 RepID=A0AAV7WNT6_PLEWA|nr:hypothetical protein NDU88_001271 [Pleurodeles waltl]
MAYYANDDDDQYHGDNERPYEPHKEERIVKALAYHVQDSVNWTLMKALKPFTQSLVNFGRRELLGDSTQTSFIPQMSPHNSDPFPRQRSVGSSSAEILEQMAASVLRDHEYGDPVHQDASDSFSLKTHSHEAAYNHSSSSDSEKSQLGSQKDSLLPSNKKHKSHYLSSDIPDLSGRNLLFDPENIIHPHTTEWVPCMEVAHYVHDRQHKSFEKEIRSTLRSECPRPSLLGKIADTPELDPSMTTFLKHFAKDPKKGLDRAWLSCQDKRYDLSAPLTKFLICLFRLRSQITPGSGGHFERGAERYMPLGKYELRYVNGTKPILSHAAQS